MAKKSKEDFIKESKEVHGEKYNYIKVDYITSKIKVIIGCPIHGDFEQIPSNHLKGVGCKACGIIKRSITQRTNEKDFIESCIAVHGSKYKYTKTDYTGAKNKIIVTCLDHGDFIKKAENHLRGEGCMICSSLKATLEDFIEKANVVHNKKYRYVNSVYKGSNDKILITCLDHGDFEQKASAHLAGHGCNECAVRGWNKTSFEKMSSEANLYIIKCFNSTEEFIKIGITTREVETRFKYSMPYNYEVLHILKESSGIVYSLEKKLHKDNEEYKYNPFIKFSGMTECFKLSEDQITELKIILKR